MHASTRPPWLGTSAPGVRRLRIANVAATAVGILASLVAYPWLPEVVPIHFGLTGEPDAFGPRWTALLLLGTWAALQALMTWLSTHPEWGNLPVALTEEHAQAAYREVKRMLVLLGLALVPVLGGIQLAIHGLPGMVLVALGTVGVLGIVIVGVVRIQRAG